MNPKQTYKKILSRLMKAGSEELMKFKDEPAVQRELSNPEGNPDRFFQTIGNKYPGLEMEEAFYALAAKHDGVDAETFWTNNDMDPETYDKSKYLDYYNSL